MSSLGLCLGNNHFWVRCLTYWVQCYASVEDSGSHSPPSYSYVTLILPFREWFSRKGFISYQASWTVEYWVPYISNWAGLRRAQPFALLTCSTVPDHIWTRLSEGSYCSPQHNFELPCMGPTTWMDIRVRLLEPEKAGTNHSVYAITNITEGRPWKPS